jgi:hypothetical protein
MARPSCSGPAEDSALCGRLGSDARFESGRRLLALVVARLGTGTVAPGRCHERDHGHDQDYENECDRTVTDPEPPACWDFPIQSANDAPSGRVMMYASQNVSTALSFRP